jgi:hypothetical protein
MSQMLPEMFGALGEDAAQAMEDAAGADAGFFEQTAEKEDSALQRIADNEQEITRRADAIGQDASDLTSVGGSAGAGQRAWPADPLTGSQLTDHDLEFLELTHEQVEWWRAGEAPLGMTPESYHEWTACMLDALQADGVPPETVDVRLVGSAARGFSGPHKLIPTEEEITEDFAPDAARTAIERRRDWLGDDPERLKGRPFDSLSKLGLDEPSDYDTNVSNDLMVEKARAWWEASGRPGDFVSGDHEYVNKDIAREVFPNLTAWADTWSERLGREVSWAVFPGSGPLDSGSGHFVHFQDDDWIVHRPEGS